MIKVHHPEIDQEELLKAAGKVVTFVETEKHVKEASSSAFSDELIRNNMPDNDHFMVHLIAMGDGENYGPNRNGDFWPKEANEKYHDTFVKKGHFFREHDNRSADKAIGIVKASAYNPDMNRIELIIHGDKEKAEEEYELAKAAKSLSFSMSARVPYDICNVCDNRATKSASYCDHLKDKMNQYIPEFQKFAYAINDKPTFFDISRVVNPADRIAHYLEYGFADDMKKAASVRPPFMFSDELARAEGVVIPDCFGFNDPAKQKILEKLASEESYINDVVKGSDIAQDEKYNFVKYAAENIYSREELTDDELDTMRSMEPGNLFRKLARRKVVLPFKSFASYITGKSMNATQEDPVVKNACSCMPGVFRDLMSSAIPPDVSNLFNAGGSGLDLDCGGSTDKVQQLMDSVSQKFGEPGGKPGVAKITISIMSKPKVRMMKLASLSDDDNAMAKTLAQAYGIYKVAYLKDSRQLDGNYLVDDNSTLILTYHNHVI
jgi:hypothetical protein